MSQARWQRGGAIDFPDQGGAALVRGAEPDISLTVIRRVLAGEPIDQHRRTAVPATASADQGSSRKPHCGSIRIDETCPECRAPPDFFGCASPARSVRNAATRATPGSHFLDD